MIAQDLLLHVFNIINSAVYLGFAVFVPLAWLCMLFRAPRLTEFSWNFIDASVVLIRTWVFLYLIYYIVEFIHTWYSVTPFERYALTNRMFGPYWWAYWSMLIVNILIPQLFWIKRLRRSLFVCMIVSVLNLLVFYQEKIVIYITSFHRDYIPSHWEMDSVISDTLFQLVTYLLMIGVVLLIKKRRLKKT